tara:strand:+ start:512 stop:829 length:318 start_codon:yes stop_codon:yes gene_type:complete
MALYILIPIIAFFCCCYCIRVCESSPSVRNNNSKIINLIKEKINISKKEDESIIICPITQDSINNGETINELPCGHVFSKSVNRWIFENNNCPVCRENIVNIELV